MATMTINLSAPTFGGVKKDYTFSGAINLPQVITAPIQINSVSLYFGWARCYYKNNYIGITIGGTHFYSEKFTTTNDDTLRERTVGLVCDSVGTDHLLKVQGRTVSYVIKNDSSSGTANVIDRPRDGDMILYLDYTILESASTLSLNTTVINAGQYITPLITPGVGAASHKIVWQFGSRTEEKWDANAFRIPPEWLDQIPTSTSGIAMATLTTYNSSGAQIGSPSTAYFTINCPLSIVPTISSFTANRVNNAVPSAWDLYVQSKSGVNLAAVGAGAYGSWITSWLIQGDGKTAQAANLSVPTISGAGDIKFTVTAIDSRGRSAQKDVTINVQPYSAPAIQSFTAARCAANGTLNTNGLYALIGVTADIKTVGGKNSGRLTLKYRLKGAANWTNAVTDVAMPAASQVIGGGALAQTLAYEIQATVADTFGNTTPPPITLGTATCYMDRLPGLNQLALFGYMPQNMPSNTLALPADGHLYFGDLQVTDLFSNPDQLVNGDFRFWQRGISFLNGAGYTADRWGVTSNVYLTKNNNGMICLFTGGAWNNLYQYIENPSRLAGKTLTASVSVQATAMPLYLVVDVYDAGENRTVLAERNFGAYVTGVHSLTFTVPTNITDNHKMAVRLFQNGAQTDMGMELNYIKLEIGNVATPYHPRPYEQELALCRRYYQIIGSDNVELNPRIAIANEKQYPLLYMSSFGFTPMRVDPTPIYFNATNFAVMQSIGYIPISALYGVSTRNGTFTAAINSPYADTISWHGKVAMVYKIGLNAEMY